MSAKTPIKDSYPPDRNWFQAVRENLEIITGRRNNKIAIPTLTVLTFSATPTKAECAALDYKVNEVYKLLLKVIDRLDS